jgi:iron complex transport system substrate-binding protein
MAWRNWRVSFIRSSLIEMAMPRGKVYIVGVGPGSSDWVSQKARRIIRSADIIVGWEMDIQPVASDVKGKRVFLQESNNYLEMPARAARTAALTGATVAVLKTGDPLIAPAGLERLLKVFGRFEVKIIPAVSTVQLAAARARISLEYSVIITYHPTPHDGGSDLRKKRKRMLSALARDDNIIVLTGVRQMPNQTAAYLLSQGINPKLPVVVCQYLSSSCESVSRLTLGEVADVKYEWQSVMVVLTRGTSQD